MLCVVMLKEAKELSWKWNRPTQGTVMTQILIQAALASPIVCHFVPVFLCFYNEININMMIYIFFIFSI